MYVRNCVKLNPSNSQYVRRETEVLQTQCEQVVNYAYNGNHFSNVTSPRGRYYVCILRSPTYAYQLSPQIRTSSSSIPLLHDMTTYDVTKLIFLYFV